MHYIFVFSLLLGSLAQADGDLEDLEQALGKKEIRHVFGSGSCSALIKLLPGNKDLYISQVTWNSYSSMLRVFKFFDIPFTVSGNKGKWWTEKNLFWFLIKCVMRGMMLKITSIFLTLEPFCPQSPATLCAILFLRGHLISLSQSLVLLWACQSLE